MAGPMKIALAQLNPVIGDLAGNTEKIARSIDRAAGGGAELVVLPELSVVGYPPRDLLRKDPFLADNLAAVERLAKRCTRSAPFTPRRFCRPTTSLTRRVTSSPARHRGASNSTGGGSA